MTDEPTDVERHEALLATEAETEQRLDAEWNEARDAEAHALFDEFQKTHPIVEYEPLPGQEQPEDYVATPGRFARYLEERTGIAGWRVEIRGTNFVIGYPLRPRLQQFGIQVRKVGE